MTQVALALASVSQKDIDKAIERILSAVVANQRIWIIGNGGSSATASHFAADLMRRGRQEKYRVRATSLTESSARLTAIGNDYSFGEVFERQIWNLACEHDLLILLSASGNSANLIQGLRRSHEIKMTTLSLVGFDGGILKKESQQCLHYRTEKDAYEVAEDSHSIACHYIAMCVRSKLENLASTENV